jgi:integrase
MLWAAGAPIETISAILGHATVAFTDDTYVEVADVMAEEPAAAIQAFILHTRTGRASNVPAWGQDDH